MGVVHIGFCTVCKKEHSHDLIEYDGSYICPKCAQKLNIDKKWAEDYRKELTALMEKI
jgi:hypothetical protein